MGEPGRTWKSASGCLLPDAEKSTHPGGASTHQDKLRLNNPSHFRHPPLPPCSHVHGHQKDEASPGSTGLDRRSLSKIGQFIRRVA